MAFARRRRFWWLPAGAALALLAPLLLRLRSSKPLPRLETRVPGPAVPAGSTPPSMHFSWSFGALLAPDGELWLWGFVPFAQSAPRPDPRVPHRTTPGTNWTRMGGASQHLLLVRDDGTLWGVGGNFGGQLGLARATWYAPTPLAGDARWKAVAATENHSFALKTDGTLWHAGGVLPLGRPTGTAPTEAESPPGPGFAPLGDPAARWIRLVSGLNGALVLRDDHRLFALDTQGPTPVLRPELPAVGIAWEDLALNAGGIYAGIDPEGRLLTPQNRRPSLPYADQPARDGAFFHVPGAEEGRWTAVEATSTGFVARRDDGSWWGLDHNQHGQLGLGDRRRRTHLTRLPWPEDTRLVAGNYHMTAALLGDGTLWTSGMKLGVVRPVPNNPGGRLFRFLNEVAAFFRLPGAQRSRFPSSDVPELLWTWPGPGTPPPP